MSGVYAFTPDPIPDCPAQLTCSAILYVTRISICHMHLPLQYHKPLTHWGRVTHICARILTIIGSDNSLSPGRILSIGPQKQISVNLKRNLYIFIQKVHVKMSFGKFRQCWWCNVFKSNSPRSNNDTKVYMDHYIPTPHFVIGGHNHCSYWSIQGNQSCDAIWVIWSALSINTNHNWSHTYWKVHYLSSKLLELLCLHFSSMQVCINYIYLFTEIY